MSESSGLRRRAAVLVAISGLAVLIAGAPLAGGVLGAFVLTVVLDTPYRRLAAHLGPKRAAGVMLAACIVLVFVPALVIGHLSLEQLADLDRRVSQHANWHVALPGIGALAGDPADVLRRVGATVTGSVAGAATWAAGSAARGLANLAVTFLCLYFTLQSSDALWARVRAYLPFSAASSDGLRSDLRRVTKAMLLGTLLSSLLQGTSMAIGFLIAGLPGAVFWGVITAFASMVPLLGSALVWVPAAVLLLVQDDRISALVIVGFGWLLPTIIDKITRARVSRRLGNVHPLTTLLGALIGIRLFGMVGLVVGPVMISLFVELLQLYERDYGTPGPTAGAAVGPTPLTAGATLP